MDVGEQRNHQQALLGRVEEMDEEVAYTQTLSN
jgi:hypothetical protein